VNPVTKGIIDPTKVVRTAVKGAVQTAPFLFLGKLHPLFIPAIRASAGWV
jgi:hypothetical protein